MKALRLTRLSRKKYRRVTEPVQLPDAAGKLSTALFLAVPLAFAMMIAYAMFSGRSLSPVTWYLTRATGITLYLLFWGVVVVGMGQTTRFFDRIASKATLLSLHTYLSQLSYAFLGAHLFSLVIDQHLPFSVEQLVVPFGASTAEPWTGFGILAMYLFIIVVASASLRRYIPYKMWRLLHVLAFPMYALSLMHGLGAGTSSSSLAMQLVYLLTASWVVLLSFIRIALWRPDRQSPQPMSSKKPFDRMGGQTKLSPTVSERVR